MRKKTLLATALISTLLPCRAMERKPDPNTNWIETGNGMVKQEGKKALWSGDTVRFTVQKDGGFTMEPADPDKKGRTGAYVDVSAKFPYLVFEMIPTLQKGGWFICPWFLNQGPVYGQGANAQGGYFVIDAYQNSKLPPGGVVYLRFDLLHASLRFKYLKMVKDPEYLLKIEARAFTEKKQFGPNDVIEFTFKAPGRLENVRLTFYAKGRPVRLNNEKELFLKQEVPAENVWTARPEVVSFLPEKTKGGTVLVKAEADGLPFPVFTYIAFDYDPGIKTVRTMPDVKVWLSRIREEHPRIFLNKDTLPKVRAWAEKIGYADLLKNADSFQYDPSFTRKARGFVGDKFPYKSVEVEVPLDWSDEVSACALAYLLTNDKKYARKAWEFLNHSLDAYRACMEKRTAISWYGIGRIQDMATYDWIYDTLTPKQRKDYITEFFRINKTYVNHGWYGPYAGVNGGAGWQSGFYGDVNTEFFMGLAAYKDGLCDAEAAKMLESGAKRYVSMLDYRETLSDDDGLLGSTCMGYSAGQYPWASYDFLYALRGALKQPVLPKLNHLLYFAEWWQWNILPGKGNVQYREFGMGDNPRTTMALHNITSHLLTILAVYSKQYPEECIHTAQIVKQSLPSPSFSDAFREDRYKGLYMNGGKRAHKYAWGYFRRFLAYDVNDIQVPETPKQTTKARHFPSGGLIFMRSGTGKDDAYALFNTGSRVVSHKTRGDENHFTIFKKGYLAIDSGYRDDSWPVKYSSMSLAHNTVLIHDPSEFFQDDKDFFNQRKNDYRWMNNPEIMKIIKAMEPYAGHPEGGQNKRIGGCCLAFSTNPYYSYAAGDATDTYSPEKCRSFVRQFLHIQPDVFLVFDRVESVKKEFRKDWLLHFLNEPEVKGNLTTASSGEGGTLRCHTLLPENAVIKKIGGPGKEFMGEKVNWDIYPEMKKKAVYAGKWRIQVSPKIPSASDCFLNVIDVGDRAISNVRCIQDSQTATASFDTPDGKKVTVTFRKTGKTGGNIRITDSGGKERVSEPLSTRILNQSGFVP